MIFWKKIGVLEQSVCNSSESRERKTYFFSLFKKRKSSQGTRRNAKNFQVGAKIKLQNWKINFLHH